MSGRSRRRPISTAAKVAAACIVAAYLTYVLVFLGSPKGMEIDYEAFLRHAANTAVLPAHLMQTCVYHIRYRAEEAVRARSYSELALNVRLLLVSAVSCTTIAVAVFLLLQAVAGQVTGSNISIAGLLFAQLFMMTISVGIVQLLLANIGFAWEQVTAVLIGWYVVVRWLLMPLPGDPNRIICWFWYPIGFDWKRIMTIQMVPFVGFCILVAMANIVAFNRRERLKD